MQNGKVLLPLLGAMVMGVGASMLAGRIMSDKYTSPTGKAETPAAQVVVAAADIAYGQEITAEKLRLQPVARNFVQPDMLHSIEEVSGKIATGDIFQGEPIINKRIADKNPGSMLASLVSDRMRAVSVRVNDVIGVAGFLLPGNRVDVLASRMEGHHAITGTVLQNIKVLAVDQTVAANKDTPVVVRAVTLEVSPPDSEKLFQAIQEGSIHLTLRNPDDATATPGSNDIALVEHPPAIEIIEPDQNDAPPSPLEVQPQPSAEPSITVIRGTTINKIVLPEKENDNASSGRL